MTNEWDEVLLKLKEVTEEYKKASERYFKRGETRVEELRREHVAHLFSYMYLMLVGWLFLFAAEITGHTFFSYISIGLFSGLTIYVCSYYGLLLAYDKYYPLDGDKE